MKKVISYTYMLAVIIFLGCRRNCDHGRENYPINGNISSSHVGAWEMVYF
jgi:hypothetical protein